MRPLFEAVDLVRVDPAGAGGQVDAEDGAVETAGGHQDVDGVPGGGGRVGTGTVAEDADRADGGGFGEYVAGCACQGTGVQRPPHGGARHTVRVPGDEGGQDEDQSGDQASGPGVPGGSGR